MDSSNLDVDWLNAYMSLGFSMEESIIVRKIMLAQTDGDRDYIRSSLFEVDIYSIRTNILTSFFGIKSKQLNIELCRKLALKVCEKYPERYSFGVPIAQATKERKLFIEEVEKEPRNRNKKWEITFPDGKREVVADLMSFCNEHSLTVSAMRDMSYNARRRSHKGFKCRGL